MPPPPGFNKSSAPSPKYEDSDRDSLGDTDRKEKIPTLKPGNFDGSPGMSWREYLSKFLNCAQGNYWSESTKVQQMKNCLTGPAASIVLKKTLSSSWTFSQLIDQIDKTYGPRSKHAATLKAELRGCRRQKDETLHSLRDDIYAKVFDVYGDHSPADQDSIGVEIFTQALGEPEIIQKLLEKSPSTLADAYQIAYNYESTKRAARSVAYSHDPKVRSVTEEPVDSEGDSEIRRLRQQVADLTARLENIQIPKPKQVPVCFYCKKEGHTIKFCRPRLAKMTCFFCSQKGHHIRDCPEKKAKDEEKDLK